MLEKAGFITFLTGIVLLIIETIFILIEFIGETFRWDFLVFLVIPLLLILLGLLILDHLSK